MDAPASTSKRYYLPELDVVRFLAFLLVFIHHYDFLQLLIVSGSQARLTAALGPLTHAFYSVIGACRFGLSLFFTLSAFLIAELLLREKQATATVRVGQFYLRRILRIWPLYYFALALAFLITLLAGGGIHVAARIGWFAVFLGAWYFAQHGWIPSFIFPLWSISVEEQFYLVAPWLLKFLNRRLLYAFSAALILVSNILLFHFGRIHATDAPIWYNSFVQFECFAAGILLSLVLRGRVPHFAPWQRCLLLAVAALGWFVACFVFHVRIGPLGNPGPWALMAGYALGALGAVLVLLGLLGISAAKLPAWAVYLGRISYGLYVFHALAIHFVFLVTPRRLALPFPSFLLQAPIALALCILLASASYRWLETPFLKLKRRHAIIQSHPV
ncbi:MAG TPA: acyltransferase [Terracidiphilus sp.]|nr:acyltransferase [Terracidiphilus sp.]